MLYVPGDSEAKLGKAPGIGADLIVADLEDSVMPASRPAARPAVASWLQEHTDAGSRRWVRVNQGDDLADDLDAVVVPGLEGIVLPKCGSAEEVERVGSLLSSLEERRGMAVGEVAMAVLVESARGVLAAAEMARCERVVRLHLGEADLCADLGLRPSAAVPEGAELLGIRVQVVLASAAAGIEPPIGPVHTDLGDLDGLVRTSATLAALGFGGRSVIHPSQVDVVNAAFSPSPEEVDEARELIERFEEHNRRSAGVFVDRDGRMVDEAVVRAARRVLQRSM